MRYQVMEYMELMVRKTCIAVLIALVMLILMGQARSRRNAAASGLAGDSGPWSAEFSLTREDGGELVKLGAQEGAFPWGTNLDTKNVSFWRTGGEDFFEVTASDGSRFAGTRQGGTADTSNGLLLNITTENPEWATARGACVGMSMEETLKLYPEAAVEHDAHRAAGCYRYTYSGAADKFAGISRIAFNFEQDALASIDIFHDAK